MGEQRSSKIKDKVTKQQTFFSTSFMAAQDRCARRIKQEISVRLQRLIIATAIRARSA